MNEHWRKNYCICHYIHIKFVKIVVIFDVDSNAGKWSRRYQTKHQLEGSRAKEWHKGGWQGGGEVGGYIYGVTMPQGLILAPSSTNNALFTRLVAVTPSALQPRIKERYSKLHTTFPSKITSKNVHHDFFIFKLCIQTYSQVKYVYIHRIHSKTCNKWNWFKWKFENKLFYINKMNSLKYE